MLTNVSKQGTLTSWKAEEGEGALQKHTEAMKYIDKALAIAHDDIATLTFIGYVLSNINNNTGAIQYYTKLLEIDPNYVDVLNNKGVALSKLNNKRNLKTTNESQKMEA